MGDRANRSSRVAYVLVVLSLVVAACGGGSDNPVFAPSDAATASGGRGVLVGSAGGVVEVTAGGGEADGARLVVPAGALEEAALIEVTAQPNRPGPLEADSAVVTALTDYALTEGESSGLHPILTPIAILAAATAVGPEFVLEPEGAQFALPVSLEIPLATAPVGQDETLVVLLESGDGTLEVVSGVQITDDRVLVPLGHFSAVKLLSIPLNVLRAAWGLDIDEAKHAAQLVGPHVSGVGREVLASHCAQRGNISFDADRMPSYFELLNNLARQEGEIGGVDFDQLFTLRGWLLDIGQNARPSVSPAEIYQQALQIAGGDAFQALVISHEVLRDDRFDKNFEQLVTDVRGDSTDEVGARYHMFGTALYGFWYEHRRAHPELGDRLVVTAETAAAWEEAYVSGDIDTDPGEFVVDLVGAQMGRDLYHALQGNPLDPESDPCSQFATGATGSVTGTVIDAVSSNPVAGAVVTMSPSGLQTVTDEAGGFEFGEVPTGQQTVAVTATGYGETALAIQIDANQTTQPVITLDRGDPLPWTFTGSGMGVLSLEGGTGSCSQALTASITLNEDGTVTGSMDYESVGISFSGFHMECSGSDQRTIPLYGHHGAGSVTILFAPDHPTGLEGPLTSQTVVVTGQFSNPAEGALEGKAHVSEWSMTLER